MYQGSTLHTIVEWFQLVVILSLAFWALVCFDKFRIRAYIAARSGRVQSTTWQLFGAGWFGQQTRCYIVHYTDANGATHRLTCRTALFGGVFFSDVVADGTTRRKEAVEGYLPSTPSDSKKILQLEKEIQELRAELKRLKGKS